MPFIQTGLSNWVEDSRQTCLYELLIETAAANAPPRSSRFRHERVNDERERTVSEPQVLVPTELEPGSAPHREVAGLGTTPEQPIDEVLDDDLLVEEISIDGMCGVY